MRDRQISVRRVAFKLAILITTVYEIMSNHLAMKKVSTRWVPKLLTPIQCANRVYCCHELLQESEVNPDNYFDGIVTGDETCSYYYDPLSGQEPRSGRSQVKKQQLDFIKQGQLKRSSWSFSGTSMVLW